MRRSMGQLWSGSRVRSPALRSDEWLIACSELTSLLPCLYNLLPLPAASLALVEILGESIFRFGKGTKVLTEPLLAWSIGPGKTLIDSAAGGESA